MSLSGTAYPCARCFKTTLSVIDSEQYDKDETPPRVGVRFRRSKKITEIVCAVCLRADYAAKISPAKKIIHSSAKKVVSVALRNDDGDEDDAGDDADDAEEVVPLKPLPRPSGLITSDDAGDSVKKKKKLKKKFKSSADPADDSPKQETHEKKFKKKLKKKPKKVVTEQEGDEGDD